MSKYELSLSKDYVKDWGVQDALRELAQNAIDHSITLQGNDMDITYDENLQELYFSNKLSVLESKSLLLGATTKSLDSSTIGQFGEGFKIALLVLNRENKKVTFLNYGANEIWTSKFVNSRRYNAEILTVYINKKFEWDTIPENNLTICVSNISKDEYDKFVSRTLQLQNIGEVLNGERGSILLEPKYKGKIFVNGLYVCKYKELHYGYDIKPKYLNIGRDRNLVNMFDIQYQTSRIWKENNSPILRELIMNSCPDVAHLPYIEDFFREDREIVSIADDVYEEYKNNDNTSENLVFVSNMDEISNVSEEFENVKTVLVSKDVFDLIDKSSLYKKSKEKLKKKTLTDIEKYNLWKKKYNKIMAKEAIEELDNILIDILPGLKAQLTTDTPID